VAPISKYSYTWARDVVNSFVENYARGTYILSRMLHISPGELRNSMVTVLASGNSLKWRALKRSVVYAHGYSQSDIDAIPEKEWKTLYKCLYDLAIYDQLDEKNMYSTLDTLRQKRLEF